MKNSSNWKFDIAFSFASEDRKYVKNVAELLIGNELNVFYDEFEEVNLWGKNLYDYLDEIYRKKIYAHLDFRIKILCS